MSLFNEKLENDHSDKVNDKNDIEIPANTNTLKYEMFLNINYESDFRKINPLIASWDFIVISTHQDITSLKI